MIMRDVSSITDYFKELIADEMDKLIDGEFKNEFKQMKDMGIEFSLVAAGPTYDMFTNYFRGHKGHMKRKWVLDQFIKQEIQETRSCCCVMVGYSVTPEQTIKIHDFVLTIRSYRMMLSIFDGMIVPETFKRSINTTLRHEIGHMLDYLRFNGVPERDFDAYFGEGQRQLDEHRKWLFNDGKFGRDADEELRTYYQISTESMANKLGGVTVDEILQNDRELMNLEGKLYTIEVKVLEVKDKPKEPPKGDAK